MGAVAVRWAVVLGVVTRLTLSAHTAHSTPGVEAPSPREGDHEGGGLGSCERRGSQGVGAVYVHGDFS